MLVTGSAVKAGRQGEIACCIRRPKHREENQGVGPPVHYPNFGVIGAFTPGLRPQGFMHASITRF